MELIKYSSTMTSKGGFTLVIPIGVEVDFFIKFWILREVVHEI